MRWNRHGHRPEKTLPIFEGAPAKLQEAYFLFLVSPLGCGSSSAAPLGYAGGSGFAAGAAGRFGSGGLSRLTTFPVSRQRRCAAHTGLAGKARIAGRRAKLALLSAGNFVGFARNHQAASAREAERYRQQQRPQK